jgi:alpha-ribazole phosphatase/probable phosphoglycerate mutase
MNNMLNIYLLRHGQTQWNAEGNKYCGRTDLPLTEKGLAQAVSVAAQLKDHSFDAIYASPLQRAFNTAQIAAAGKEVLIDDRLIEADFGEWEGKPKEQFIKENEYLWNSWMSDPLNSRAGGTGETAAEVIERVDDFFTALLHKYQTGNVLVVAHNGVNRLYLAYKLGMNVKDYRKLFIDNSTVTMFELDEQGEMTLVRLNSKM